MNDKKDVRVIARQCSNASSISTRSGTSRSSLGSKSPKEMSSRRSSITSTTSTASRALSHTLSATEQFIDPSGRREPGSIERIDGLTIRLLDESEKGRARAARFLDDDREVCYWAYDHERNNYDRSSQREYRLPAIAQVLKLDFNVTRPGATTTLSWIHLCSCRRESNDKMDKFIRDCAIRLLQMSDPKERYIKLPACFYLEKIRFGLGIASGCATYAWLVFDASWVRRTIESGLVTAIDGDLKSWRGKHSWRPGSARIQCERKGDGQRVLAEVTPSRIDSSRAFPSWLDTRDEEDFAAWCGAPAAVEEGGVAYLRNFQVKKIRLDYFGDVIGATLVRAPGAPKSLPQRPKPEPVKKRGFLHRRITATG